MTDETGDYVLRHRPRGEWGGTVEAFDSDGARIGYLDYASDGFVECVGVREQHWRKGVATALLHAMPIAPAFSTEGNTPMGDAWIASLDPALFGRTVTDDA
jgi:hypothetical protein